MGTWPCGKVVMVGELLGAESKAQVYRNIYTFLQENSDAMTQLGIFIIYLVYAPIVFSVEQHD